MKLLDIFNGEENLFVEENNKKYKKQLNEINKLINEFCVAYKDAHNALNSAESNTLVAIAKGLNEYLFYAKKLRLDVALNNFAKSQKEKIAKVEAIKTKLLANFTAIENPTEAIVCLYNLEGEEFTKCAENDEVIVLGEHHNILHNIKTVIENLTLAETFESIPAMEITYNADTLNANIAACKAKAAELYAGKQGKLDKANALIEKLEAASIKVVSFYTYKERLEQIGCDAKCIKAHEGELTKEYIPLKKAVQKEFKLELQDICNVQVDESTFPAYTDEIEAVEESEEVAEVTETEEDF